MTSEELDQFLRKNGATLSEADTIVQQLSLQVIQSLFEKAGQTLSVEVANRIASEERGKFAEHIKTLAKGSLYWKDVEGLL